MEKGLIFKNIILSNRYESVYIDSVECFNRKNH